MLGLARAPVCSRSKTSRLASVVVALLPVQSVAGALRHAATSELILNPWEAGQPADTGLGNVLVGAYGDKALLDLNLNETVPLVDPNCPAQPHWPDVLEVIVPDPCNDQGNWNSPGSDGSSVIMDWSSSCGISTPGLSPILTYTTTNGALFATSQKALTLTGTKMRLLDCNRNVHYILEEKVYHQPGRVDPSRCQEFGSCEGTVYFQYFIRGPTGAVIAKTRYLRLFEEQFTVSTKSGSPVAMVQRLAGWLPNSNLCGDPAKKWMLRFESGAGVERWPVAALVTMMTLRDARRVSDGFTWPSGCELGKSIGAFLLFLFVLFVSIAGALSFRMLFLNRLRLFLIDLEDRLCPKRILVPSKFEFH